MALTTTSGYTFPVAGVPTTQNPNSGTAYPTVRGRDLSSYGAWNGNFMGYLNYMAERGDSASLDRLMNYFLSEQSSAISRDWVASREDTQYQRLVADMKAAGLNPYFLATQGGSPISSGVQPHSYSGQYSSAYEINKEKNQQNWLKVALSAALPIIGALIAAAL